MHSSSEVDKKGYEVGGGQNKGRRDSISKVQYRKGDGRRWQQDQKTAYHYMRDHASCLTPILQGRRVFLEMWRLNFLVSRVCYVSRSNTLKSRILKKSHGWVLSTAINYTHPVRAEITGIWQGIESFVVEYWHWVKSEANIPKRLEILRTPISLVSFWHQYLKSESGL